METKSKNKNLYLLPSVLGLGAGIVTYLFNRKKPLNPSIINQLVNKNFVVASKKGWTPLTKLKAKIFYSHDIKSIKTILDTPQTISGLVYNKNILPSKISADIIINPPSFSQAIIEKLNVKSNLSQIEGLKTYIPETKHLSDIISKNKFLALSDQDAITFLNNLPKNYFLKPESGEALGKSTNLLYGPARTISTQRLVKPKTGIPILQSHTLGITPIKNYFDDYILQEQIVSDPKIGEVRIHTLNNTVIDTVKRFGKGFTEGKPINFFKNEIEKLQFEKNIKTMLDSIPEFKNRSNRRLIMLGFDATRDLYGQIKIFEINPNSGFIFNPHVLSKKPWDFWSTHNVYKFLTDRDTSFVAGLKGLGATALVGGGLQGGMMLGDSLEKKAKKSNENKIILPLTIAGLLGLGTYMIARKPWLSSGRFFDVQASNVINDSKRSLIYPNIISINQEHLLNIPLKSKDIVYAKLPARLLRESPTSIYNNKLKGETPILVSVHPALETLINKENIYRTLPTFSTYLPRNFSKQITAEELQTFAFPFKGNMNQTFNNFENYLRTKLNLSKDTHFFIKEKEGYGSSGTYFSTEQVPVINKPPSLPQEIYDIMAKKPRNINLVTKWKDFIKNPQKFIIQEQLPKGGKEFRVTTYNGEPLVYMERHKIGIPRKFDKKSLLYKQVNKLTKDIDIALRTDLKITDPKTNLYLGHDLFVYDKGETVKLIETNTQEGLFNFFPNYLYKHITKKDLTTVAILKGLGIGAAGGIGVASINS